MLSFQKIRNILFRIERVEKIDTLSGGKTQSLRQSLVLRFSPDSPFSTKTSSANGFAVLTAVFLFKVLLRRHLSAYVTDFKSYPFLIVRLASSRWLLKAIACCGKLKRCRPCGRRSSSLTASFKLSVLQAAGGCL